MGPGSGRDCAPSNRPACKLLRIVDGDEELAVIHLGFRLNSISIFLSELAGTPGFFLVVYTLKLSVRSSTSLKL